MKKRICFCVIALICCFTLNAQSKSGSERYWKEGYEKIRIISYNIFNGFDWGKDPDRKARFVTWIKEQDPEVLAMQELCGFTQESLSSLAKEWGHPYAVIVKENGYPVGITSKSPITLKKKITENCGHGLLHVRTYGYDFLVTHLNPSDTRKRRKEAEFIVNYIQDNNLDTFMLMGDMNSHSPMDADYMENHATNLLMQYRMNSANLLDGEFDYSIISRFLSYPMIDVCRRFVPSDQRRTFPTAILMDQSRHPEVRSKLSGRIDFIFTSPNLIPSVVDAFIWNDESTDFLSDHYPIGVDLLIESAGKK